ncbi:inositol monophosphatase family protein [Methylorubrum zatmanii]
MRDDLLRFALHLADLARPLARAHFRTPLAVETKADASLVTQADRGIEALLRAEIRRAYPDHGILGEEEGGDLGAARTWVIDPIDGTKSFVAGLPLFGTLIALAEHGRPVLGVIDMPILNERWHGAGGRAWLDGAPIRTGARPLSEARLFVNSPDRFRGAEAEAVARLSGEVGLRRYGGDCYAYALLASGHCDLVLGAGLAVYDVFALMPVIEGAGGLITDWQGRPITPDFDGRVVAAANPALHGAALERLAGEPMEPPLACFRSR